MKNIIILVVVFACIGLIIFGVMEKNKAKQEIIEEKKINQKLEEEKSNSITEISARLEKLTNSEMPESLPARETKVEKAYPDGVVSASADSSGVVDGRSFQLTSELIAKLYLVDKYNPGICYGTFLTPATLSVNTILNDQKFLAEFLRQQYNLTGDLEVYNKIKQINGVQLKEISSSNYNYSFMDGQCAILVYHEGRISVINGAIDEMLITRNTHDINDLKTKK